jgi:hypothetical protein
MSAGYDPDAPWHTGGSTEAADDPDWSDAETDDDLDGSGAGYQPDAEWHTGGSTEVADESVDWEEIETPWDPEVPEWVPEGMDGPSQAPVQPDARDDNSGDGDDGDPFRDPPKAAIVAVVGGAVGGYYLLGGG